jgi:hypothetical protein
MKPPYRYLPFANGIHSNVGTIRDADNKSVCSFVNRLNAQQIINALNKTEARKGAKDE